MITLVYRKKTTMRKAKKDLRKICRRIRRQTEYFAVIHNTKHGAHIHIATNKHVEIKHMKDNAVINISEVKENMEVLEAYMMACKGAAIVRKWGEENGREIFNIDRRDGKAGYQENGYS